MLSAGLVMGAGLVLLGAGAELLARNAAGLGLAACQQRWEGGRARAGAEPGEPC